MRDSVGRWRRSVWAAAALAGLLVATACAPDLSPSIDAPRRAGGGNYSGADSSTLHPGLRDCAPAGGEGALDLAPVDLSKATWKMPPGFEPGSGYHEDNPVEDLDQMWAMVPIPQLASLDVATVNLYINVAWNDFTDDCEAIPLDAVGERLAQYRTQIGAEPLSDPYMLEIDGHPAIAQDIRLALYDYTGYWLFSPDQLLHVYCQWETRSQEDVLRGACTSIIDSLEIP